MTSEPGFRPSRFGLIARLVATVAVAASATVGAVLVRSTPAAANNHGTAARPSNAAVAAAEAQHLLDDFAAPPGSDRLAREPSGVPASTVSAATMSMPYQVSKTSWWRSAQPISNLVSWLDQHPEQGLTSSDGPGDGDSDGSGQGDGAAGASTRTLAFSGRPTAATLDGISLTVTAYALGGDSTVLRVVAAVDYVPSRPTSEVLPAASQLIVVPTFAEGSKQTAPEVTLTDPAEIARIEQVIDDLPKAPSGVFNCPFDNGAGLALDFEDAQSTTLADVVIGVMGCQRVQVSINGYNEPALSGGLQAAAQIQAILGTRWALIQPAGS